MTSEDDRRIQRDRDYVPCGVDDHWRLPVTACIGQGMTRVRSGRLGSGFLHGCCSEGLEPKPSDLQIPVPVSRSGSGRSVTSGSSLPH
jgi:hypothetical protein